MFSFFSKGKVFVYKIYCSRFTKFKEDIISFYKKVTRLHFIPIEEFYITYRFIELCMFMKNLYLFINPLVYNVDIPFIQGENFRNFFVFRTQ